MAPSDEPNEQLQSELRDIWNGATAEAWQAMATQRRFDNNPMLGDEPRRSYLDVRPGLCASPQDDRHSPGDRSPRTRRSLGLFTDFHAIEQINNLDGNRVRIKLSGFTNTDPLVPCEKDELQMSSSDPGFEMRMIMLLGAFFSGRKVRFAASQCSSDNRFILVGQIHVHEDS